MLNNCGKYVYAIECEYYQLGKCGNGIVTKIGKWENEREYEDANVLIFQSRVNRI